MRPGFLTAAVASCILLAHAPANGQSPPDTQDAPGEQDAAQPQASRLLPELPEGVVIDERVLERAVEAILALDPSLVRAILPSPDEALSSLAQFESSLDEPVAWRALMQVPEPPTCGTRSCVGLQTGAAITDFLLALRARDAAAALTIVEQLRTAAPALGVSEEMGATGDAIALLIAAEDWEGARAAMDRAFAELPGTESGVDPAMAALLGAGAWLRSISYVGMYLSGSYSPDASRILRQGVVARALAASIQEYRAGDPSTEALVARLLAIAEQMDVPVEESLDPTRVERIGDIAAETLSASEDG